MIFLRIIILCALSMSAVVGSGHAGEISVKDAFDRGVGQYTLGDKIWNDLSQDNVVSIYRSVPAMVNDRNRELGILLLASPSKNRHMTSFSKDAYRADEIVRLRTEGLISIGAFHETRDLLKAYGGDKVAVSAVQRLKLMFLEGSHAAACVEANVLYGQYPDQDFIGDLYKYCTSRYGDDASDAGDISDALVRKALIDKKYKVKVKKASELAKMPVMRLAMLASMGRLRVQKSTFKDLKSLPSSHLLSLLYQGGYSKGRQFSILVEAVRRKLVGVDLLSEFYTSLFGADDTVAAKGDDPLYLQMAVSYLKMKHADTPQKHMAAFGVAVKASHRAGMSALYPHGELLNFAHLDSSIAEKHWKYMSSVLIRVNPSLFANFAQNRFEALLSKGDLDFSNQPEEIHFTVLCLISNSLNRNQSKAADSLSASHFYSKKRSELADMYIKFLSALDITSGNVNNRRSIYEKHPASDISPFKTYQMPDSSLAEGLALASQNNQAGRFVFLALEILHQQNLNDMYPSLVDDLIRGIVNVGKKQLSQDIAASAVIETIMDNN